MGEHVCIQRKNATYPNRGCKWCGNLEPPMSMYRVSATTNGSWSGPFCNKKCFINYEDNPDLKRLYVHTVWRE